MHSRWEIVGIHLKEQKVFVKDSLFKKVRVYVVPNITSAHLEGDHLKVNTHTGKIMRIVLPSGSRGFVLD